MKKDYAKICFIILLGIIGTALFGTIFYVSMDSNFSVASDAANPIMANIWLFWIYLIPLIAGILSIVLSIIFVINELMED